MALPRSSESRTFYRCAVQRFDEGALLLSQQMNTAAVYLAGYGVECMLKALILESVDRKKRIEVLGTFRGRLAHDFEWLFVRYKRLTGATVPDDVVRSLTLVGSWSTDLRYQPGTLSPKDASEFLRAARTIMNWADGRL